MGFLVSGVPRRGLDVACALRLTFANYSARQHPRRASAAAPRAVERVRFCSTAVEPPSAAVQALLELEPCGRDLPLPRHPRRLRLAPVLPLKNTSRLEVPAAPAARAPPAANGAGTRHYWLQHNPCSRPSSNFIRRPTATSTLTSTSSPSPLRPSQTRTAPPLQSPTCMLATRRLRSPLSPSAMASAYSAYHGAANASQFTITALGRWSSISKQLPPVDKIKALHVYDFDNTLFKTPLPNPAIWNGQTLGTLASQDVFVNGGWWHDNKILAATGQGLEIEEPRAWQGWWNETVVDLVRLTIKQPDALCVLLTGRSESGFAELVKRMVAAKGLDFDIVGLKPQVSPTNQKFQSTMHFKQLFLNALMETYKHASVIKVYEDRPKHTKGFREFFAEFNRRQGYSRTRGEIDSEVIQVADQSTTLDPVIEVAEVQNMINLHNQALAKKPNDLRHKRLRIKKTVFFTSYMINPEDAKKLEDVVQYPPGVQDLRHLGNSILICPRPCPASILEKVGGMGSKMLWEVTGTACLDNSLWAARVRPVPATAVYHTDNPVPLVVLALRKGARPMDAGRITKWDPIPANSSFVFESTVGEKIILRVERDDPKEDEYESLFANKAPKRKHAGDDDWAPRHTHGQYGGRNESRGYHTGRGGGRGRGGAPNRGNRNNPRGGGRGGRGRGGFHNYRSLDDVEPKNDQGGYGPQVDYDDAYPPLSNVPTGPRGYVAAQQAAASGGQAGNAADLQNYY
ncbi:hypothetical protein JDV02_003759 [Purpureocillium takamizusanense]|uniref:Swiss Army Knife RNA repair protein HAD domain-containing protein n=1 Tax=Purpureocillium takamizusanense TaxID=2060973 RepID=A0A9Q8QEG5_9HYPO|nr:uncharacterized protein JDV02_003759 [Purpureocillium takamizusanense]UNI17416.1 hypothetical protein JDV02_003759 [Purpureocillium takamizusanense]